MLQSRYIISKDKYIFNSCSFLQFSGFVTRWKMTAFICYFISCFSNNNKKECRTNFHNIPLPSECHTVLTEADIGNRPVFVIGDVHGCLEELCELLDAVNKIEPSTMYVFVGDLVNRGPDSVGVVRKLREMAPGSVYAVRGNHDESALREALLYREDNNYALSDKYHWIKQLTDADFQYLSDLPYTVEIPCLSSMIVHAGIIPGRPLRLQVLNDLTNMRNIVDKEDPIYGGGLVATNKHGEGVPWITLWPGPTHVYFGHDARRKLQKGAHATGLDTGCCHGGELTGVFIGSDGTREFISVKSRQPNIYD